MRIGGIAFQPYIYRPNVVSRNSLSRVKPISEDLLSSKTDFSGLSKETTNPLRRGETSDFADVVAMQMQMSRLNQARIMKPAEEAVPDETAQAAIETDNNPVPGIDNVWQTGSVVDMLV